MFKIFLLIAFTLFPYFGFTQNVTHSEYRVHGRVNIDTGSLNVEMAEAKELYPASFKNFSVKIKNGKFFMAGKIQYPIWLSFRIGDQYTSESTAIMPGSQTVSINIDSNNSSPRNNNSIMAEEKKYAIFLKDAMQKTQSYRRHYDSLKTVYPIKFPDQVEYDSRKELKESYAANDMAMLKFIKANPNSYYALFRLYHIINFGFNQTLGKAYDSFSPELKRSPYGELLAKRIIVARQISVGEQLPDLNVKDEQGAKINMSKYAKNKYILIDLWYSHCAPCIAQFNDLKDIYSKFSDKGFEIIAISTDKEKYVNDWKEAIIKHKLPWPQYLDLNAVMAHNFNVKIYPSSLLVDQNGTIVSTDISPVELKFFLNEKLQ